MNQFFIFLLSVTFLYTTYTVLCSSSTALTKRVALVSILFVIFGTVITTSVVNANMVPTERTYDVSLNIKKWSLNQHNPLGYGVTPINKNKIMLSEKWEPTDLKSEIECLAKNMYFEAGNQGPKGQIAVGLVTINRVLSDEYPNDICNVVWQRTKSAKTKRWIAQFSWTKDRKSDVPDEDSDEWMQSQVIAAAMLDNRSLFNFKDFTKGATHFHTDYVHPKWNNGFTKIAKIGNHIFYRDEQSTPYETVDKSQ